MGNRCPLIALGNAKSVVADLPGGLEGLENQKTRVQAYSLYPNPLTRYAR